MVSPLLAPHLTSVPLTSLGIYMIYPPPACSPPHSVPQSESCLCARLPHNPHAHPQPPDTALPHPSPRRPKARPLPRPSYRTQAGIWALSASNDFIGNRVSNHYNGIYFQSTLFRCALACATVCSWREPHECMLRSPYLTSMLYSFIFLFRLTVAIAIHFPFPPTTAIPSLGSIIHFVQSITHTGIFINNIYI